MPRLPQDTVLAAIDVGTNAVKLELARPLPDGSLESLHQERDPVRPGEGVFKTGRIPHEVCERLLAALRRYGALCRRYRARVRAVATSALREAKNKDEIIQRARREAGLNLEVVSGREEALVKMGASERRRLFDPRRADIIVPGAVILEALALHLKLESVTAVDRGLRDGILVDLMRRRSPRASDRWLVEAAEELGRRWRF